ncbi:MAG: helix-turn-helix domain-containing protein [Bacteroidales bacterium]|jgi:hypothetical protein|nr:helix-turn-helix domain-containing protein [Bacteroidales bacterium]
MAEDTSFSLFNMAREFVNETSHHVFLTGKAGTGKTTFLREIVKTTPKNVVVAAPTGVAAINAGGVTLHSLFQLPLSPYLPNQKQDLSHFSKQKMDVIRQIDLLIIDEVSMLRADTLDAIDAVARRIRRSPKSFGGMQMLYIGDMFQLPPVVKDEEWALLREYYQTQFFFHAHALRENIPVYIELKKVYRQQDQSFIDLLNRVRNNVLKPEDFDTLNNRFHPGFTPTKDAKFITLTTHNYQADKINAEKLQQLQAKTFEYEGTIDNDFPDHMLPCEKILQLKEGAQIMFVKNDSEPEKQYYNGKIGTITKISKDEIWVLCENEDNEILLHTETWENNRYTFNKESGEMETEVLGTFTQFPLRLAWAITVHKSQGLTFNHVILDISRSFAAGQAYVALSRCTSLEGLILQSRLSPSAIQTDRYAIELSARECSKTDLEKILKEQKLIFWIERVQKCFDLKSLFAILLHFDKLLIDKTGKDFDDAKKLIKDMRKFAYKQEDTVKKFQNQLRLLCIQAESTGDMTVLKNRCQKAAEYFYPLYMEHLILPFREKMNDFANSKRTKTYYNNLLDIEQDLIRFVEKLKKVYFYNKLLVDGKLLHVPEKEEPSLSKVVKPQKGDSAKQSLEMFLVGNTISGIARERELKESTIMAHLTRFISTGEVSVFSLISKEKVEKILPLLTADDKSTAPVKELLGDEATYDEIRAVIRHKEWLEKQ